MNTLLNLQIVTVTFVAFTYKKGLIFALKSSTEYNIDSAYRKKGNQIKFLHQTQKIWFFMVSIVVFFFQNYQNYYFFFSQERKLIKELFHSQGNFQQTRKFCMKKVYLIREIFYKQGSFPQTIFFLLDRGSVPQTKIFTQ